MMTQTLLQSSPTCQSCPFFEDYQDKQGSGWCQAFDKPARQHHPISSDCDLVSQNRLKTVRVELYTRAVEDDGHGYPVPVDSQVIEVTVDQFMRERVEAALHPLLDLSRWVITHFWQPESLSEF
jgi:hypothetical protein